MTAPTKPGSLAGEFSQLSDLVHGESESFLIWGGAGSGKTWFIGTAGSRTLILNNGMGMTTLQSPLFRSKFPNYNPILANLREKIGARGKYSAATVHDATCDTIDKALKEFPDKFDTIAIDDGSALRRNAMNKALELNSSTGKSKTQEQIVDKYGLVVPAMQDYQTEMRIIDHFIGSYIDLAKQSGKHIIICAHERMTFAKGEKMGDEKKLLKKAPLFTGTDTNPDIASQYFDNVFYFEVVGGGAQRVYRCTTSGHETLNAKTRWGGVFETVESNPDFLKFIERIKKADPSKLVGVRK
jgi:hypothetical protein